MILKSTKARNQSLAIILFSLLTSIVNGQQSQEKKTGRPDIPGTFLFEVGFNAPQGGSSDFDTQLTGSRTANVYYVYDVGLKILTPKLTFVPGFGLGLDRFKFKNNYTLEYESATGNLIMSDSELGVTKSQLITNYLDIPLGLRYSGNPADPSRSFKVEAGIRGGVLISSFTKIKYEDENDKVKAKTRRDWELEKFRYGLYTKIGFGNFNLMGYYNFSTLFKKGQGPDGNDVNNFTFGISIGGF